MDTIRDSIRLDFAGWVKAVTGVKVPRECVTWTMMERIVASGGMGAVR